MNSTATIVVLLTLIAAFAGGMLVDVVRHSEHHSSVRGAVYAKSGGQLTNPLIECGIDTAELGIGERAQIEKEVNAYVDAALSREQITHAAIYFRDLNNGPWFGINEREQFQPGSLLKLPIAMSIYYWDQRKHGVLDDKIDLTATGSQHRAPSAPDESEKLLPSGVYSVRDLVSIMLRQSSNDAANVLAQYEGTERMDRVFTDLGIEPPVQGANYTTDVKTYGAFFRVLFNASYVGQDDSEDILTMLTQATFRDGLVAGVPAGIKVAHKYGTRIVDDGHRQLHDCGIVYTTQSPYVLCIMTQGTTAKNLERFIAGVSKIVYDGVTND